MPKDEDDRLTCEKCGRKFYPVWYDPAVITVSPVWCNLCLYVGDEEDE